MLRTLRTLARGARERADESLRDAYAIELIDQRIREAEAGLRAGKTALAAMIQRRRGEERQIEALDAKISDLTQRAKAALKDGAEAAASEAASAIAAQEKERAARAETLAMLSTKAARLQASVENTHRRLVDLKLGATSARAVRREREAQAKLSQSAYGENACGDDALDEAEALIKRTIGECDPLERTEIVREINANLSPDAVVERLAAQGYGPKNNPDAADVLARLKSEL